MEAVREPRLVQTLRAVGGEVTCADALGALLLTGGGDRSLRSWRWAAARGWEEAEVAARAHRYGVTVLRLAQGGVLAASGGVDGAVRVWATRGLAARRALAAPGAVAVRALCWAGHARLLAGHDDGALCVWVVPAARLLARLRAHDGALHAVCAPGDALLLTACTDGVLKVFDLPEVCRGGVECSAAPLTWVDGAHDLGALCAAAADSGDAATGGHDGVVRVWRRAAHGGLAAGGSLVGHGAAVTALCWGGELLASASLDRTARLWHPPVPAALHVLHAHTRYLTCLALDTHLGYLLTGSNDKCVKMWSLGALSLDHDLETPCVALEHFALGDLEGIEPVLDVPGEPQQAGGAGGYAVGCGVEEGVLWRAGMPHGPINSVATSGHWVATAASEGVVVVYEWCAEGGEGGALVVRHTLVAHHYPATAVDFGANGALLLSAGLDGRACLYDVQSGVSLRTLSADGGEGAGGEVGGGGVRGARLSSQRPARLLLATDDGLAPVWTIDSASTQPLCMYGGHADGAWCGAWGAGGRVCTTGAACGELRLVAPPRAPPLCVQPRAHELGVQSCDFAPECSALELPEHSYLLATAGGDSLLKLWIVDTEQEAGCVVGGRMRLVQQVEAHGGGVSCVRWGACGATCVGVGGCAGSLVVSSGADGWARVWRVSARSMELQSVCGARAGGAGGVLSVALLHTTPPLLVCGTLDGELSVWRVPADGPHHQHADLGVALPLWDHHHVVHWLRENVTHTPGAQVSPEEEAALVQAVYDNDITGSRLIGDPIEDLLEQFGFGGESTEECLETAQEETQKVLERGHTRATLRDELRWVRSCTHTPHHLAHVAPHSLLCPLSHQLLMQPARAADGYSYERANILDWFLAQESAVSPVSLTPLHNSRVVLNYALRDKLRAFLREHGHGPQ